MQLGKDVMRLQGIVTAAGCSSRVRGAIEDWFARPNEEALAGSGFHFDPGPVDTFTQPLTYGDVA